MKPKKNCKGVSNYPPGEKKHQRSKFESAYFDKPQIAISGAEHTANTPNGNKIHRKKTLINPKLILSRKTRTGGMGRGDRMADLQNHHQNKNGTAKLEVKSEPEAPPMETESPKTPELSDNATFKKSTFDRSRAKLIAEQPRQGSSHSSPDKTLALDGNMGPLTIPRTT